jgi:hypothetical protein
MLVNSCCYHLDLRRCALLPNRRLEPDTVIDGTTIFLIIAFKWTGDAHEFCLDSRYKICEAGLQRADLAACSTRLWGQIDALRGKPR